MTEPKEPIDRQAGPLDYARQLLPDRRISRLAILALVVALLSSPCLLGPLSNWINWYVPQQFNQVGRYGYLHFYIRTGAMIVATLLPVVALIRIRASRGRLLGKTIAWAAFVVSLLWWVLLSIVLIAVIFMASV